MNGNDILQVPPYSSTNIIIMYLVIIYKNTNLCNNVIIIIYDNFQSCQKKNQNA